MKKKILIVTSTFPKNGEDIRTAGFVSDLAVSLTEYYRVHVLAPHSSGAKTTEVKRDVTVHRFRYFFPVRAQALTSGNGMLNDIKNNPLAVLQVPFFMLFEFLAVLRIARKEKIDIINSHWIVPQGLICSVVKKLTGTIHVATVHAAGIFLLKRMGRMGGMIARFIDKRCDGMLPVSRYIASEVTSLTGNADHSAVIPMGVDTEKFSKICDKKNLREKIGFSDKFTFLFVGKFVEKKGLFVLFDAVKKLKDNGADFKVVIAGGGPLEERLKNDAAGRGLTGLIEFAGWKKNDELPEIYSASDVVVVPSVFDSKGESEGMPVVINEAFAAGVPVLASGISGITDLVENGRNGWLAEAEDASDLAGKMGHIMGLPDLESFSKEASIAAAECSYTRIAERYKNAIDEFGKKSALYPVRSKNHFCMTLNLHEKIKINIYSGHRFYIDHFKKEYPDMFCEDTPAQDADIKVFLDEYLPERREEDVFLDERFKKIYHYRCLIRGLSGDNTEVYFKTPAAAVFLCPALAAVFFQAEILEPLIYLKALKENMIMAHASGVFDERGAYLFTAETGTGKTTTAFHLVSKGFGFLGDDLVFLSKEGEIYSYPKRVHFFNYLKEKNPFLKIPAGMLWQAEFRHLARVFLKLFTGKHFYFSTRLDITEILPSVRVGKSVSMKKLFLLRKKGQLSGAIPEKEKHFHMVNTCDTRESLIRNILKDKREILERVFEKEADIIGRIAKDFAVEEVLIDDIAEDNDEIVKMINGVK